MKEKKRYVTEAKWLGKSEKYEGLYKYNIKIHEKNGSISTHKTSAKDLQDALKRIIHQEQVDAVIDKSQKLPFWLVGLLFFLFITAVVVSYMLTNAILILYLGLGTFAIGGIYFFRWLERKNKKN